MTFDEAISIMCGKKSESKQLVIPDEYKVHYSGTFGECYYDIRMFRLAKDILSHASFLHYNQDCGLQPYIPEGYTSCFAMFRDCKLPVCFTLGENFDTSNVRDMGYMFENCELPAGFTLGSNFNTSNVTDMDSMFKGCKLPEGFSLGNKFNTANVTDMYAMFKDCEIPECFTLGDEFNTSIVKDMRFMFEDCRLPEGFTLGEKFDISNVKDMRFMFENCELPRGIDNQRSPEEIIEMLKKG